MNVGELYFVKDEFYNKFDNHGLIGNKGEHHGRPCCYAFKINESDEIYWMIPISSQISKYENLYQRSINKYGMCDNLEFGYVKGEYRAFLIQNMFPILSKYIDHVYIDENTHRPVKMARDFIAKINAKARKKYKYNFAGKKFGMSDIVSIYNELIKEM